MSKESVLLFGRIIFECYFGRSKLVAANALFFVISWMIKKMNEKKKKIKVVFHPSLQFCVIAIKV